MSSLTWHMYPPQSTAVVNGTFATVDASCSACGTSIAVGRSRSGTGSGVASPDGAYVTAGAGVMLVEPA